MWYINRHFDLKQIDTLPALGFSLRSTAVWCESRSTAVAQSCAAPLTGPL